MANTRRDRRIARHVRLAADHERALAGDLRKIFAAAGRAAAAHVALGETAAAESAHAAFEGRVSRALRARLQTAAEASAALVVEELTGEKAGGAAREAKRSPNDAASSTIAAWLAERGAAMVAGVLDSIRRLIRNALRRGAALDEPPRVLARRIRDETAGQIGRKRAEMIARTETHTATQVGAEAAARATGLTILKEWGATEDKRTRPAHAEADAQTVEQDADFIVGGEHMRFPGDTRGSAWNVINCRCVALYHPRFR